MASITPTEKNIQALLQELEQTKAELAREKERSARLEEENHTLRSERGYLHQVMRVSSSILSPAEKLALLAVREKVLKESPAGSDMVPVKIGDVADEIGMSRYTSGRTIKTLVESGVLEREGIAERLDSGRWVTEIKLGLTALAAFPALIERQEGPRNHGGKRHCKNCGSHRVEKWVSLHCLDCGHNELYEIGSLDEVHDLASDQRPVPVQVDVKTDRIQSQNDSQAESVELVRDPEESEDRGAILAELQARNGDFGQCGACGAVNDVMLHPFDRPYRRVCTCYSDSGRRERYRERQRQQCWEISAVDYASGAIVKRQLPMGGEQL